jgi:hypothetical protein
MSLRSIAIVSSVGVFVLGENGFLLARRYGVKVELTRNADANRRLRELQADELLRQIAANPKITVATRATPRGSLGVRKKSTVLCILDRRILSVLVGRSGERPLLERLETIDVESALHKREEIGALI